RAMEESGQCRRGYFVEGLGAAQFALPGAVDRMRAATAQPHVTGEASAGAGRGLVLAAADPANAYGAALPWPTRPDEAPGGHRPGRKAGALVVLTDGELVLYVERGGKTLLSLTERSAGSPSSAPTGAASTIRRSPRRSRPRGSAQPRAACACGPRAVRPRPAQQRRLPRRDRGAAAVRRPGRRPAAGQRYRPAASRGALERRGQAGPGRADAAQSQGTHRGDELAGQHDPVGIDDVRRGPRRLRGETGMLLDATRQHRAAERCGGSELPDVG